MEYHILEQRGGGAEVQAWLYAKELARRGYEVSYIAQSINGKADLSEWIDGVEVHWLRHFLPRNRWFLSVQYYRKLKTINPDLIIQRYASFLTGVIGLYAKLNHKKFVWICTDNATPFKWSACKKQLTVNRTRQVHHLKGLILLLIAWVNDFSKQIGIHLATIRFTQNEEQQANLRRWYGYDSYRIFTGHELPRRQRLPSERFELKRILWVANLGENKQPEKFFELARLCKDTNCEFIMIGGHGDEDYVKSVLKHKPENVRYLGKLPFEETLRWFDQSTIFVNTSKAEGFPNTFVQAWLRGTPVLSLGVDPNGIIAENNLGIVVANLPAMAREMKLLLSSECQYRGISEKISYYAKKRYIIANVAGDFLNIISK